MTSCDLHVGNLIKLRAELIKERRSSVSEGRSETLPEIAARIDAIDKSIDDEKKLADALEKND
jgi:hypothetical protein